jgi:hypothetical protein
MPSNNNKGCRSSALDHNHITKQGRADRPCCYLPVPQAGRQQQRSLTIRVLGPSRREMFLLARREGLSDNARKVFGFALALLCVIRLTAKDRVRCYCTDPARYSIRLMLRAR